MQKHIQHNKDERNSSLEKYTPHFIERVVCERELEIEQNCNILTPTIMALRAFLSRSPGLLNRGLWGPASMGHGSHSSIFSPTNLLSNCSIEGPEGHSAGCWFSLQHLISNSFELPVHRVISLFYAHSIFSQNWPTEYAPSVVFGMACLIIIERK